MKKSIVLMLVLLPYLLFGQNNDTVKVNYIPKITGLIKAKWEYCFDDHTNRFDLRHSRIGIGGTINPYINYRLQVEYSSHGEFTFLDAYATIKPWDNFTLWVGQFTVPFSEDYVISPSLNMFVNRSFVAKFINPGARDIGARVDYTISKKIPFTLQAGIYNGVGINNPEWQDSPFILGRLVYGTMDGLRASVKYYGGKDIKNNKIANYGVDFRYAKDRYNIEAEYVFRDSIDSDAVLSGAYLQGGYIFPVNKSKLVKYIQPTLRTDIMGYDAFKYGYDISRITVGVNFGLDTKLMTAELRLNYENFITRKGINNNSNYTAYFNRHDKGMFDKFTIELFIKF